MSRDAALVTSHVELPQVFIKNQTKLGPSHTVTMIKNFGPGNCIKDLFLLITTFHFQLSACILIKQPAIKSTN